MVPDTAAASVTRPHISSRPEKAILCLVCSDKSFGNNFGAITCESCKAFFRRTANERDKLACPFNDNCEITIATRKHCRRCRLEKCFAVGMIKEWIQSEEQLKIRRAILKERKLRRGMGFIGLPTKKLRSSPSRSASESGIGGSEDGTGTSSINSDNNYNITNASLLGISARRDKSSSWNTLTGIGPKFIKQVDNPVSRHHHVSNSKQYYGNQQSVAQFFNKITDQNFFANLVRSNIFYPTPQRSSTCQNSDEPNQRSSVITFTGKSSTSSSPALSISSSPDQETHDTCDSDNNRVRHHESDPEVDIYPGNFDPDCQPIYQSLVKKKLPISAPSCHPHSPPLSLSLTPSPQSSITTSKISTTKPTQSIPSSSSCSLSFSTEASTPSKSHHSTEVSNIESNNNILSSKKINCWANFSQSVDQEGFIKPSPSSSTLSSSSHLEDPSKSLSLNVFHHIIDSYFTRINMKNERLNTGFALNSMEETRLVELTLAYGIFNEPLSYSFTSKEELLANCYNASVCQLITMTKKLSTYCELPIADQIILLRGTFADILAMRGAFLYDVANSSWPIKGTDRLIKINQLFDINESFYNSYLKFILDLSPTWRDNIFINQLIIAIMLFNCNLSGLKSSEAIRLEYCAYIYLLQRYMESSFNLKDTAKETLCTILCKINQLQTINGNTVRINQSNDPLKLGTLDSLFLPD